MFHQHIKLPLIVESINIPTLDLKSIFEEHKLSFQNAILLTGGKNSSQFSKAIYSNNQTLVSKEYQNIDNSFDQIKILKKEVSQSTTDVILGVGGGKVLDTAKFLASKTKLPYFAVPTALSSDALASPISIIKDGSKTKAYPTDIPSGILIDYQLISKAGNKYIISGLGDIFSNLSAINDWDLAVNKKKAKPNNFARFLSEVSVNNILTQKMTFEDSSFIKTYINSIIMSGLAMNIAGSSRPCSGSEHLLAHAIEASLKAPTISHGLLVGSLTPFCLHLQNQLSKKLKTAFNRVEMKINLLDYYSDTELIRLFCKAKKIRGDRYTVLEHYTGEELAQKYHHFTKNPI